jgi:hypothetical protein
MLRYQPAVVQEGAVISSQRLLSIRRSTSKSNPDPRGRKPVTTPSLRAAHDEVVSPFARRVRQVAEQIAAAEIADHGHGLAAEFPRLERQGAQRRRDHRLRRCDGADLQYQLLARSGHEDDSRPSAKLPARGSPDSRRPTSISCPRTSTAPLAVVTFCISWTRIWLSPPRRDPTFVLDELAVHEHVLEVEEAGTVAARRWS